MTDLRSSPPDGLTHTPKNSLLGTTRQRGVARSAYWRSTSAPWSELVARARFEDGHTRPGGMVAGPILFTLADTMASFVTISRSPKGSEAFTTAISMEFLRPARVGVLLVKGRVLRFGRRTCVVDTAIHCSGLDQPVAHAVVTYAPVFADKDHVRVNATDARTQCLPSRRPRCSGVSPPSLSSRLRTRPTGLRGKSSRNSMERGNAKYGS